MGLQKILAALFLCIFCFFTVSPLILAIFLYIFFKIHLTNGG